MRDRAEIVGARNDPLGQQESRGQLAIRAGRAHDHRERAVVQPDFEGLLGRRAIDLRGALAARHPDDADGAERLGHGHHLTRAMMRQHALDEQPPAGVHDVPREQNQRDPIRVAVTEHRDADRGAAGEVPRRFSRLPPLE